MMVPGRHINATRFKWLVILGEQSRNGGRYAPGFRAGRYSPTVAYAGPRKWLPACLVGAVLANVRNASTPPADAPITTMSRSISAKANEQFRYRLRFRADVLRLSNEIDRCRISRTGGVRNENTAMCLGRHTFACASMGSNHHYNIANYHPGSSGYVLSIREQGNRQHEHRRGVVGGAAFRGDRIGGFDLARRALYAAVLHAQRQLRHGYRCQPCRTDGFRERNRHASESRSHGGIHRAVFRAGWSVHPHDQWRADSSRERRLCLEALC